MSIVTVGATPATRERHRELQQRLNDARHEVRQQQNLLSGTRHEMSQLMAQIQEMDQQMMHAAEALEDIQFSLAETELRIEETDEALEAARAEYDLQFEIKRVRTRAIHENGSVGFWDVLFQAESIEDFLTRLEFVRALTEFDRDVLERLENAQQDMLSHRDDLTRWTVSMENLQAQYRRVYDDLEFLRFQQQEFFDTLAEDEERLAELVAIAEYEERMTQSAFNVINAQLLREQSEAARARTVAEHSARLAQLNNFDGQFMWPIPTHSRISSPFGMRMHPIQRRNIHHSGVDVGAPTGTRLLASADGIVRFAGWSGGYGNTVIIDHGNGYSTLYAHNSRNRVTTGQSVTRGQHIADVGSTGMSTGPHLHFEIRINNRAVDPMAYFPR
jgi:murein DD-endopeptidase MepM/ murein hydrolase activator NlpD